VRELRNDKDRAAKALGLARSSLFKRLKEWGLGQEEG
jgi:DNA-binding protein Fis